MAVHPAALAFGPVANRYHRARPGYPGDAVAHVLSALALCPGVTVVDVAAGTGKLTRLLVSSGAAVVAVEPVAGMRDRLAAELTYVAAVGGVAEALPLRDRSVDAVTIAQAVHWFGDGAVAELARVVRAGGVLAVVQNVRDLDHPLQAAISAVRRRLADGAPSYWDGSWQEPFGRTGELEPLGRRAFSWRFSLDRAGVLDQVRSLAPVAAQPPGAQDAAVAEVESLLPPGAGPIELPYTTEVHTWRRR